MHLPFFSCTLFPFSGRISNAVALAVCIDCEFQLWHIWLVFRVQDTSVGYAGQNQHVQVYWNTLLVLPVIALSLSCARLLPSFSLSPYTASLNSSHLIPCSLSFVLYVFHHLRHPLLLPPLALFHHLLYPLCFCYLSLSLSLACFLLYFHLHCHSPHSNLTVPFLTCRIWVQDNWVSITVLMNRLCRCHRHRCPS